MNKHKQQMHKAKRAGMSNNDVLMMKEIARKQAEKLETETTERAFLFMMAIPLNVLFNDYWQKSAKKKAPKFINEVIKLFNAVQDGIVTEQDLADFLDDMAGVNISAEWMKGKVNQHD